MNRSHFHSGCPSATHAWINALLLLLLCLTPAEVVVAQSNQKNKLQKQYKSLLSEIQNIEHSLKETANQKKESLHQLESLSEKIYTRESLIENLNRQLTLTNRKIQENSGSMDMLSTEITALKENYAQMLRQSYKNQQFNNEMVFLLSSRSFYEAWQRFKYIRRINEYQRAQADLIERNMSKLQETIDQLEEIRNEKQALLNQQQSHKNLLVNEKKQKDHLIAQLSDEERKLRRSVKQKNDLAKKLDQQIQTIILQEIKLAKERAKKKQMATTPKAAKLSSEFVSNKGKLPWPVEKGHIISRFGRYNHPEFKNLIVENNGIDIKTIEESKVKAVFEGSVVSVFYLPGKENSIIVKHGEYFTVYTNVVNTTVKAGDEVNLQQHLGTAYTDKREKLSMVHFELWKGDQKLNPELWLAKAM